MTDSRSPRSASSCRAARSTSTCTRPRRGCAFALPRHVQETLFARGAGGAPLEPRRPAPGGPRHLGEDRACRRCHRRRSSTRKRGPRDGPPARPPGRGPAGCCRRLALSREHAAAFGAARFGAVIGQLQDTFIVAASDDEVFFIDQHVAHERVLFERLWPSSSSARCRRRNCSSRSRSSWARARPTCSRSGPPRSRGWASASRASADRPSCCARCPRCSRARSRAG